MPIETQASVQFVLAHVAADMEAQVITTDLRKLVDGASVGLIGVRIEGADFASFLGGIPANNTTRADDIAGMVYEYALAKGLVAGKVV